MEQKREDSTQSPGPSAAPLQPGLFFPVKNTMLVSVGQLTAEAGLSLRERERESCGVRAALCFSDRRDKMESSQGFCGTVIT